MASVGKSDHPNILFLRQKHLCSKNTIDTREARSCLKASVVHSTRQGWLERKVCHDVLLVDASVANPLRIPYLKLTCFFKI